MRSPPKPVKTTNTNTHTNTTSTDNNTKKNGTKSESNNAGPRPVAGWSIFRILIVLAGTSCIGGLIWNFKKIIHMNPSDIRETTGEELSFAAPKKETESSPNIPENTTSIRLPINVLDSTGKPTLKKEVETSMITVRKDKQAENMSTPMNVLDTTEKATLKKEIKTSIKSVRKDNQVQNMSTIVQEDEEEGEEEGEDEITILDSDDTYNSSSLARPWFIRNHTRYPWLNVTVVPFERQEGVVIATKIHGPHQLPILEQSLCLLHYAYNNRPLYDIVVFTTALVTDEQSQSIRNVVYPANITFVIDNRGLQEEIAALSPIRHKNFLEACGVKSPENLTWWSNCPGRIAYNWQAEFRAWHIWRNPALKNYKWMMWMDADAFCTRPWTTDPLQAMIENDLVILFDNWPKGTKKGRDIQDRIWKAFNLHLCKTKIVQAEFRSLTTNITGRCGSSRIADIHGFFHITNLDFYRTDIVQKWGESWIGDGFLQRRYDDQSAVTVPAAVLAPSRAWDMRRNKIHLDVYHNFDLDGKKYERVGGFLKYWKRIVKGQFPEAATCKITAGS